MMTTTTTTTTTLKTKTKKKKCGAQPGATASTLLHQYRRHPHQAQLQQKFEVPVPKLEKQLHFAGKGQIQLGARPEHSKSFDLGPLSHFEISYCRLQQPRPLSLAC